MFNMINDTAVAEVRCPLCGKTFTVTMPMDGFVKWQGGMLIQEALPMLSNDERELLISGICPSCWEETFSSNEDEDYDDCDYEVGFDPYMGCFSDDC